jgi:hypothetical protein
MKKETKEAIGFVLLAVIVFSLFVAYAVIRTRQLDSILYDYYCGDILYYADTIEGYEEEFKAVVKECRAVEN